MRYPTYLRIAAFIFLPLAFLFDSLQGMGQTQIWYPGHSIGTQNGVYSYNYTQTPSPLVEIFPAAVPNTGLTYQWYSSTSPVASSFQQIPGAISSSYQPPALSSTSVTTWYYRVTTSSTLGSITSNTIKIAVVSVNWEDMNYIREHDVLTTGQTSWTAVDQLPIGSKLQNTTYVDGLGRVIESVGRQVATPAGGSTTWGDVVQFALYDAMGREPRKYLSYTTTNQPGFYKTSPLSDQTAYYANAATYNESSAFVSITFDNSPLNRVTNLNDPGSSWAASQGNTATYDMNTAADNVQNWRVDYVQGDAPIDLGTYGANQLYKDTYKDVNGNQVIDFVNKSGQTVLKKIQVVPSPTDPYTGWLCTYNVYDDFGLLRFQIQPEGVKFLYANSWTFAGGSGPTVLAEQVFQYNYDDKGRTIWKKAPGALPINMIYDTRDRLVFLQDGNQNAISQWTANLYDGLDRPVLTTLYATSETVANLQSDIANSMTTATVSTSNPATPIINLVVDQRISSISSYIAQNSITFSPGFSSAANDYFTASINSTASTPSTTNTVTTYNNPISSGNLNNPSVCTILKYLFYDNYSFATAKGFDNSFTNNSAYSTSNPNVIPISPSQRALSMTTGSMVRVLGTSLFLSSTEYYDEKGRHIQSLADNIKSGTEINTFQYRFDGNLLSVCNSHTNVSAGYAGFITLNKYIFDNIGRVDSIQKQLGGNPLVTIASYTYDDKGRIQARTLAPGYSNSTTNLPELETLNYSFNIHNQITGINKDYALKTAGVYSKWGHYFGLYIGYDNKDNTFNNAQLDGQITGLLWNTQGDDAQRKYDYTYDNANRLANASFNQQQHPGDGWSNSSMDFSVSGYSGQITYDNNGNLTSMLQKGVMPGQSAPFAIDDLRYSYMVNGVESNRLQSVTDMMTSPTFNGMFGDFKDGTNASGTPDYVYDNNGNIVVDLNKNAQSLNGGGQNSPGIHYNYLDKPDQIRIVGQGTILIVYDADGNKLQRAFVPDAGGPGTVTSYINQYVYQETATLTTSSVAPFNGSTPHLAYINFEEGRIRAMTPMSTNNGYDGLSENGNITLPNAPSGGYTSGAWDYFILDYQRNVRMVLTEETHSALNECTMETTNGRPAAEDPVFGQTGSANEVEATRTNTPSAWTGNTSASVSHLGNLSGHTLGPNSLQKVMAGDMVTASVSYYYPANSTSSNPNIVTNLVANMMSLVGNGPASAGTLVHNAAGTVTNNLNGVPGFVSAVEPNNYTSGVPQAYLTVLFFDERFNFISAADGGVAQAQVRSTDAGNPNAVPLTLNSVQAPKNGYVYIYLSNRSDQDVYFDNLAVNITAGNIIEEDHYYSFGLRIAAISSHKLGDGGEGKLSNPYQYNDKEMLDEDAGLNWYDYGFRNYDPQIGRFPQLDPLTDEYPFLTPYQYASNDPITNIDQDGLEGVDVSLITTISGSLDFFQGSKTVDQAAVVVTAAKATKTVASGIHLALSLSSVAIHGAEIACTVINASNVTMDVGKTPPLTITYNQLKEIFPHGNAEVLNSLAENLNKYMDKFGIDDPLKLAHFLGQAAVETGGFTKMAVTENRQYTVDEVKKYWGKKHFKGWTDEYISACASNLQSLLNYVYQGNGNGDENSGDGYKYRGRGILQLTHKGTYKDFNKFMHDNFGITDDLVQNPELVSTNSFYAIMSALWHFSHDIKKLHLAISKASVAKVTLKVNGGSIDEAAREKWFFRAVGVLIIQPMLLGLMYAY